MNFLNHNKIDTEKLKLHKSSSNNNLYLFPIKYNKHTIILKTPSLIIPYGISKSNYNKEYITFTFPNIFDKHHIQFYRCLLKIEKWCELNINCLIRYINKVNKNKENYQKISKRNIKFKKIINTTKYDPTIQMKLSNYVEFFDKDNNKIDKQEIQAKTNCKTVFFISGIWFNQVTQTFGVCLHCHLLKLISIRSRCLVFDDDENEHQVKIDCTKLSKNKTKKICCPNCDETIVISLLNYIEQKNQNNLSLQNIDPQYEKYIKMKKFGVPLMAIKQKIITNQLDYNTFLNYLHNNKNENNKIKKTTNDVPISKNNTKRKIINFADLLKQKGKLKKTVIKPKSSNKKKWYMKGKNVPTLQDILKTLQSLKSVKKKFDFS